MAVKKPDQECNLSTIPGGSDFGFLVLTENRCPTTRNCYAAGQFTNL